MKPHTTITLLTTLIFCTTACTKEKTTPPTASTTSTTTTATTNNTIAIATPATNKPTHQTYKDWHDLCLQGKKSTIDNIIEKYKTALATNKNDHLAQAYLGSAHALRAKATFWGPTKLKYLKKGKTHLDTAVKNAPNNLRVRMVRAIGYYKVPKEFKTRPTAISDFEFLLKKISKKNCPLATNEKQAILYHAHLTYKEENHQDAARAKKLCHQLNPKSTYGKLTQ